MSIMEIKQVGYSYDNKKKVLKGVNAEMEQGKLYAILGPSGCGKTTLLSLIGGLDSPGSGQITFDGQDIAKTGLSDHRKNHVAFIFQAYNLIDYLTPAENVSLTSKLPPLPILERLGLTKEEAKRNVLKLSGGQQQRVAIARALVKRPDILLLDEPLSNLDARLRLEMREEIRRIQAETGVTTVFVTHDQEEAMSITDEIVLMRTGVVQQQCPPQQMYLNPANRFVAGFLGNPPINFFRLDVERCVWQRTTCSGCAARRMGRSWWASGLRRGVWGRGFGLRLRLWRCGARICWLPSHWQGSGPAPFWTSPPVWRQATPGASPGLFL